MSSNNDKSIRYDSILGRLGNTTNNHKFSHYLDNMRRTVTSSSTGQLRAALLQDLAPSTPLARPRPSCLLCTHSLWSPSSRPLNPTSPRHLSTPTTPRPARPRPPTHYDLFPHTLPAGPPPTGPFAINLRDLRAEFLQLQARAHPDRHAGASKPRAEAASALINDAYKTLQDPLLRAQYLLRLRGMDVAEDETARVQDPGLLMEVLEVREGIEAAREVDEVEGLRVENERRVGESVRVLEGAFERDDLEGARGEAVRLRYWVNIGESLREWEGGRMGGVGVGD